nr:uncharacterized protein LOC9271356 [Oryza sativa Japonica Group]XP_025877659.1 uncharacterized protein LOC9271356 [Oryza sativa Japonica Group]
MASNGGNVPPMSCPQFDGENTQLWRDNCEIYFDVYGVHPANWVKVALLNFTGNASFWLQSVRHQMVGISWMELCDMVCHKFTRDRQATLIRQWIHVGQTGSVAEYVERFDNLMHHLLSYDNALTPPYFLTKFVDGLKDEIRGVVMIQKPVDLDAACSVAMLQEEILDGNKKISFRKAEGTSFTKAFTRPVQGTVCQKSPVATPGEEKRILESARTTPKDDKVSQLRSYRRSKGLCFTHGERWSKDHKCAQTVQLHVVELEAFQLEEETDSLETILESNPEENNLMTISVHAWNGTDSAHSLRVKGLIQGTELLMLINSGSTHSFVDEQMIHHFPGVVSTTPPVKVRVADKQLPDCVGGFKVDAIDPILS